jgi:hypothetical protein
MQHSDRAGDWTSSARVGGKEEILCLAIEAGEAVGLTQPPTNKIQG